MTATEWDAINGFASDVGWSLVFGLNVLLRSPWPTGSWYPDNAISLMEYTYTRGYQVDWELGNGEPACVTLGFEIIYATWLKISIMDTHL